MFFGTYGVLWRLSILRLIVNIVINKMKLFDKWIEPECLEISRLLFIRWDHPFSEYAKFPDKQTFLTP